MIKRCISLLLMFCAIISCSETEQASDDVVISYNEKHRPQFHFSPAENWMNDPNGLVYYDDEYHLFYQYYPDSTVWGPMHWGHATSADLVHWDHLPIALYPDSLGYIFSGSVVVDKNRTSGLGSSTDTHPPMVAMFTHHDAIGAKSGSNNYQVQSIAYSVDKGRTWIKYANNPVINNPGQRDFRDPKVIWDDQLDQWTMVLAANDRIKFYTSPNLINWTFQSDFGPDQGSQGRPWECPDLFPLTDKSGMTKWILIVSQGKKAKNGGSGTQYFVGDWDGKEFVNDNPSQKILWLDHGKDNYAGVTYSDIPDSDGRRIFIGWMSNWQYAQKVPTELWRSAMTIPRELVLKNSKFGFRISSVPVVELEKLRVETFEIDSTTIREPMDLLEGLSEKTGLYEVEIEVEWPSKHSVEFVLSDLGSNKVGVGYEPIAAQYFVDRTFSGPSDFSPDFSGLHFSDQRADVNIPTLKMRLFIDHSSVELFVEDDNVTMTETFFPKETFKELSLSPNTGIIRVISGKVHRLSPIW